MFYDEELKVQIIEALDGSEVWAAKSTGDTTDTIYLHHWDVEDGQETFETFSPSEARALAVELIRVAGEDPEPHIWEVYVNIRNPQGRTIYQQLSLHATKAGAEQEVENQKKAYPVETSDPNFTLAARKLKIGA